jgi:predicted MPP superfamily phosphohydrolase/energy-coupling factor transporter ATP-binding protein EcfA2
MEFSIIHLSDLHIKNKNFLGDKFENIKEILKRKKNKNLLILAVTGDIAFSGKKEEYDIAKKFFSELKKEFPKIKFCIAPGNHDCNFLVNPEVREVLLEKCNEVDEKKISLGIINGILEVQNEFKEFKNYFSEKEEEITKLHYYHKFKLFNRTIVINILNTAWMSTLKEKQGALIFPLKQLQFKEKGDYNIVLFHHNFNWFSANNSRELKKIIEKNNELILSGHEHTTSYEKRSNLMNEIQHIEGSVLYDSNNIHNSGFNILDINLNKKEVILFEYIYDKKNNCYNETQSNFDFNLKKRIADYELEKDFEENFLYDVGANFHHPRKRGNLDLRDIYIFPDLKKINFNKENEKITDINKEFISALNLKKKKFNKTKILIIGDEKSGKTTLAKILYDFFREKEIIPLYIDIDTKNTNPEKIIKDNFKKQYNKELYQKYLQENTNNRVVIIDNLERVKDKVKFLEKIEEYFDNIILFGGIVLEIDSVFYHKILSKDKKYEKYKIEEFGNELRYRLIDKWNKIGLESFSEDILLKNNEEAKKIIDLSIGKNIVPSYPIFILTSLQMLETRNNQNYDNSTQGYYYQYLITESISKFSTKDLDTYFNFLSELSFLMFKSKNLILSREEVYEFHNKFKDNYSISPYFKDMINFDILISNLEKNNIIASDCNGYTFKYKYIYYFFISKYLADNISLEKIRKEIDNLIDKIYQEEAANIVLFLTHHTKNEFIIERLLENSKIILKEFTVTSFTDDIIEINKLVEKLPTFSIPEKVQPKKNKLDNFKQQDRLERTYYYDDIDEESPEDTLELAKNLNLTFKSIEIIGNILKSYHGSLQKEIKLKLGREAYFLGLRAIGFIFDLINEDIEMTTKRVEDFLSEKNIISSYEKKELAKKFLFDFLSFVAFSFMEKTASSLVFDKLSLIFDNIQSENKENNAIKLINLMMELVYKKEIPINQMKKLKLELKNNNLGSFLLKTIVIKFLYFTSLNYADKQKICSLFDIRPVKKIENNIKLIKR